MLLLEQHISLAAEKPADAYLGELLRYAVGYITRNAVLTALYAV